MEIKSIIYLTQLEKIPDISNGKVNVRVETTEGMYLTMTICTPLFYFSYMEKLGLNFVPASAPDIIVRELTCDNIHKALEAFCENDGYWMKLFFISGNSEIVFSKQSLDEMMKEANKWYYEDY